MFDPVESELAGGWMAKLFLFLLLACPFMLLCNSLYQTYAPREGLVVAKQAFFPSGLPSRLLMKVKDPSERQRATAKPVIYKEFFDSTGKEKVDLDFPTKVFSKKPWYKITVAEKNGREHILNVTEHEFMAYALGQYMKKRLMASNWIATPQRYTYRDYYWGSRYYTYRRYYSDYDYGYYGARSRGYRRSSYGSYYRGK